MTPFPGTTTTTGPHRRITLTPEQEEWMRLWYPMTENRRLIKASGLSHSTFHRFAKQLGLKKSEEGFKAIKKRQAAHIKRKCTRNGYYESMRGREQPEALREATKRMWQEIRDGKRPHPLRRLKEKSPRKYGRLMKKRSEQRKELIRNERMRAKWGLPRKTNLTIAPVQPYTRSQANRRYYAKKTYGYILAMDHTEGSGHRFVIYYDDDTARSEQFERNGRKAGFRFERWEGGA